MPSRYFYSNLEFLQDFQDIVSVENFVPAPTDWLLVCVNTININSVIDRGMYKTMNNLIVASIAGILNLDQEIDLPFVFAGDSAVLLIPPHIEKQVYGVLKYIQKSAKKWDLHIRTGVIPMKDLYALNTDLKVAKLIISSNYVQSALFGKGLDFAQELLKHPQKSAKYIHTDALAEANLAGFSSRWQPIKSKNGEIISLVIRAISDDTWQQAQTYKYILSFIQDIYSAQESVHPVHTQNLAHNWNIQDMLSHSQIQRNSFGVLQSFGQNLLESSLGFVLQTKKQSILENADYQKFDGSLKMVFSSTPERRIELGKFLNSLFLQGKIVYGLHISSQVLLTSITIKNPNKKLRKEVHFVDGDGGGLAIANKNLHKQLKNIGYAHDFYDDEDF